MVLCSLQTQIKMTQDTDILYAKSTANAFVQKVSYKNSSEMLQCVNMHGMFYVKCLNTPF